MIEFAVRKPVAVFMICAGLIVLGVIAAKKIPLQLLPTIASPELTIVTEAVGFSPEEIEKQITIPIERSVATVSGLVNTSSNSDPGRSEIRLKLRGDVNFLEALSAIREKIDSIAMPENTRKPKILRSRGAADALLRFAVRPLPPNSIEDLSNLLQGDLVRTIERVPGVALVSVSGAPEREIQVRVNSTAMYQYGLNLPGIAETIQNKNTSLPAGEIQNAGAKTSVRLGNTLSDLKGLLSLPVKSLSDRQIQIRDIASVEEILLPPDARPHLDGETGVIVEVRKEAEANSVTVASEVKRAVEGFFVENRELLQGTILSNQGEQIATAIDNVTDTVIHGGFLAALVIFLLIQFLWPTLVVSVSMPLSLLVTLILMYFFGISFNLMSLAGLALGVGMLVDNSTIVLDSIHKAQTQFKDKRQAALRGAQSVAGAITASTLSTMAVFGPLAFVEGTIGQMFRDVAATVCFSMAASLFVALIVILMLSSLDFKTPTTSSSDGEEKLSTRVGSKYLNVSYRNVWQRYWVVMASLQTILQFSLKRSCQNSLHFVQTKWQRYIVPGLNQITRGLLWLEKSLRSTIPEIVVNSRKTVVFSIVVTLLGLFTIAFRGAELFPDEASQQISFEMEFAAGQSVQLTEEKVKRIEKTIETWAGVEGVSSISGVKGSHTAILSASVLRQSSLEVAQKISQFLTEIPDVRFNRKNDALISSEKPIQIQVFDEDLEKLKTHVQALRSKISQLKGLTDVSSDLKGDISELNINFDREALDSYGVEASGFGGLIKSALNGASGGQLQIKGQDLKVRVLASEGALDSVEKVKYVNLAPDEDKRVYLSEVARVFENSIRGSISHENRKRVATISANLFHEDLESAGQSIAKAINELKIPELNWKLAGQDEERARSQKSLIMAVCLSIFLIYLMLAGQFESLLQPAIILCAVPLCISGVAVFLILFGLNVSALVFVGFIILVGSSVNTSIVMVDFANQLVLKGHSPKDAITEATVRRMRPILVTTASNVFGHLPMALALGQGAALQQPLAVTLIGGLISSTLLTMLVVPILYGRLSQELRGPAHG